ncbi:MAG: hypothetical protein WBC51_04925 [Vicinamibacterales bacterium]
MTAADDAVTTITFSDPYTFDEWLAAVSPLLAHGPTLRALVDRTRATAPSREFVDRMANFFQRNAEHTKGWRAAVVTGTDAGYGVARMLQLTNEARAVPMQLRAFRDFAEARRWLASS